MQRYGGAKLSSQTFGGRRGWPGDMVAGTTFFAEGKPLRFKRNCGFVSPITGG